MQEQYTEIAPGWLYQTNITAIPVEYNYKYINIRYNTYPLSEEMSKLRYDKMMQFTESKSVLDVGYGNGSFLSYCDSKGLTCYGYDISGYPLKSTIKSTDTPYQKVDTVTFFDSIEHFQQCNLWDTLLALQTKWIIISVPWCHWTTDLKGFEVWKHRRPNEHFHHFNEQGIRFLLEKSQYEVLDISNVEDKIRISSHGRENILTVVAKKLIRV